MRKLIFMGGIHGVGKTHLCEELRLLLAVKHVSAGDLIRRARQGKLSTDKRVISVEYNQQLLISALDEYLKNDSAYLVDGHFVLLKKDGEIEAIAAAVFEAIRPTAVVVLRDDISAIIERLKVRDSLMYDPRLLQNLQDREIEHAQLVCQTFGFPLLISNPHVPHERADIIEHVRDWVSA